MLPRLHCEHRLGRDDARLRITLYDSYTEPGAKERHAVLLALRESFGDELLLAFRHLPTSADAVRAAVIAEAACTEAGFWRVHERLLAREPALWPSHDACGASEAADDDPARRAARARVAMHVASAASVGVTEPPVIFIGDERYHGPVERMPLEAASRRRLDVAGSPRSGERDLDAVALVAHELRSPLGALSMAAALLDEEHPPLDHPARGLLQVVRRQATKLNARLALVDAASRQLRGGLHGEPRLAPTDLAAVVASAVETLMFDPAFAGVPIRVELEPPGQLVGLWPEGWLELLLENLLSNALKYGRGEPVDLTVRRLADQVRVTVRDRGIGIPPDELPTIFEPFRRGVLTRSMPGLGLGLHVVATLVRRMYGSIRVESRPGEGTMVTVTLPMARAGLDAAGDARRWAAQEAG